MATPPAGAVDSRRVVMRILFLSEPYPPEPIVGALRAANVARSLAARGHRVEVMAAAAGPNLGGTTFLDGDVHVHVVRPWYTLKTAYARARQWIGDEDRPMDAALPAAVDQQASRRARPSLLRRMSDLLSVPDDHRGWVPVAVWQGLRIGRTGVDLIYSTSPSHSTHVAAMILADRLGCPWIAEFRDPWTDNNHLIGRAPTSLAGRLDRFLESKVLARADQIVVVTEGARRLFATKVGPQRSSRVRLAMNGIVHLRATRPPRVAGPRRLVYAGSIYPPRDPRQILNAFAEEVHRRGEPWVARFIGDCRRYDTTDMEAFCRRLGLDATFTDWVEPEESRREVEQADLLLLPAQRWVQQLPNKLFDYLGARVPVLAFCERESQSAQLLAQVGGHHVVFTDEEGEARRLIGAAIDAASSREAVGDETLLKTFTVERQMAALVANIERFMVGSAAFEAEDDSRRTIRQTSGR